MIDKTAGDAIARALAERWRHLGKAKIVDAAPIGAPTFAGPYSDEKQRIEPFAVDIPPDGWTTKYVEIVAEHLARDMVRWADSVADDFGVFETDAPGIIVQNEAWRRDEIYWVVHAWDGAKRDDFGDVLFI